MTFSAEPPAMHGDTLAASVVERRDALRVALLHGEDDIFRTQSTKSLRLLPIGIVAHRAHGELVAAGFDAAERGREAGHGCMLDRDAEQLADGVGRSALAAAHASRVGDDLVGREGAIIHGDHLARVVDFLRQFRAQGGVAVSGCGILAVLR